MFNMIKDYVWNRSQHYERKEVVSKEERDIIGHIVIVTFRVSDNAILKQTSLELAQRGAKVIMAVDDTQKAQVTKEAILKEVPGADLVILKLDTGDMESIRQFSATIHAQYSHIDMLINNARIYEPGTKLERTKDGFEQHIGINYLGPFLLTLLLLDLLNKGNKSRIVTASSMSFPLAQLIVEDLNFENTKLTSGLPYANSKLASILFTRELARRL